MSSKPHILLICGRGQWRSPTAAKIYENDSRIEVRFGGVSPKSTKKVTLKDVEWADLIFVMEKKHKARLQEFFSETTFPKIISLDIPDDYPFMDPELIETLHDSMEPILSGNKIQKD